ncbi:MAG: hypothetical protein COW30_09365 [Rhodospirillales bacterium CG15_BIG_FIL_POST_REV_8_21_14_020_66_15]|nr:MAG: hypothetical protein COW30_09365 [Rhodospirillales bacterium CG15_BIG_FIL_POST_REV_8_21_14_020_66_15]
MNATGNGENDGTAPASLEAAMTEVETMIRNARRALAGGELLDMTPLGERVAGLCDNVRAMALASSDPDAIRRRLEKMVADLNRLEEEIRAGAGLNPADGGADRE